MTINPELKYSRDHEWVKEEDGLCVIGISDFAQDALGDLVFVNLPEVGDAVTAGEAFGDVESVKAVSDLLSPRPRIFSTLRHTKLTWRRHKEWEATFLPPRNSAGKCSKRSG